ncbi:MAG TPA: thioester reductase domain-containing protein, partial [Thermoanaerobaculia bacterium]|nr:thioester reductase domain-containing protein [Thermoanaerobaculia bacterium]
MSEDFTEAVAVIGMAGRFPGARDLDELWRNLRDGVESVRRFTDEEMLAEGMDPATIANPSFVRMGSILDDVELFDAAFFGFSPREAEVLDPQQRVFMECAWEALERAGYAVDNYDGWIGLFAGISMSSYLWKNLAANPQVMAAVGEFQAILSNDRDYFTTRVSYKLNLKGPSINVQTACSTSLVAVHLACQSLLSYQSTIALAGGVRINFPRHMGYLHQEGGIFSPDGHCRAFDAQGAGALFGEGCGVVVLKRLSEALADGDTVHAVIKATAINNDGSGKVGYTAPSVDGQAEAIALAHAVAGVDPETIAYVEAHGSGTPLGDPIEVTALTQAFRAGTDKTGFCGLGSIKTNVGHLEAAAGIAGFLKTVLALENRTLPPSLHFQAPNPRIDFAGSPFYVNTEMREWTASDGVPRRAGVSSFGMGGTNVHAVLEEAPAPEPAESSRPWQLLVLSARTETALDAATGRLAAWLEAHPEQGLADIAWTLQAGRRAFDFRRALVCRGHDDAVKALAGRDPRCLFGGVKEPGDRPVAWMLSGLGEHHARMGEGLYRDEPSFCEEVDRCAGILRPLLGLDLREVLYPGGVREEDPEGGFDLKRLLGRSTESAGHLAETWLAQPALFVIEIALARLWRERGVEPAALVGYSLGEYTAAYLAGVMPLETALRVVGERAKLIQQLPAGAMLAVPLPEEEAVRRLGTDLSLAAVNSPVFSVVAGPVEAIAELEARLAAEGLTTRRLDTTHAFHSRMMDPVAPRLVEILRRTDLRAPEVPLISNVTGTWMTAEQATDPEYWARHLCRPVRFGAGLEELRRDPARLLLEVGPGQALATLALQHPSAASSPVPVLRSMRHPHESRSDSAMLLEALGKLWLAGVPVDWTGVHTGERRRRVPLPPYPFERQRFFIEARPAATTVSLPADTSGAKIPPEDRGPKPAQGLGQHARPHLKTVYVAPCNELEEGIATIWRGLLGLREVGVHDGFFELGGNSLVAPRLVLALRDRFGVDLPVAALFDLPSVADLAGAIERIRQEGAAAVLGQQAPVDLRAEVVLDPEIAVDGLPVADWRHPQAVVLTGATGFLGAFLLRDLLEMTGARVFCPARADSAAEAGERVRRNLESRGLWKDGYADRIVTLVGDLGQPLWGLSEGEFGRLAKETDAVYHCGAWVNFLYPYRVLKPINVQGTVEALRLASREKVKAVHFISSVSAISFLVFAGGGWACEDHELVHTEGLFGGYGESKWVAEQIVKLAQARGIPATIHRPGVVSGDSVTGAGNTRDMIWNMMKGCIQLGVGPERDFP